MTGEPSTATTALSQKALRLAGTAYRRLIRRLLPDAAPVFYSGIPVAVTKKVGDNLLPQAVLPFMHHDIADYEATLIGALREVLRPGDRIVIVGGGLGVTSVVAARAVGAGGSVSCFEGSATQIGLMRKTFERNGLAGAIALRHAIVAENRHVYGGGDVEAAVLPPSELPECDVLELDCEGAEAPILAQLAMRPRTIVVETHGLHGAPTAAVRAQLEALGYAVEDRGWAEPSRLDDCIAGDIRILLARRVPHAGLAATP